MFGCSISSVVMKGRVHHKTGLNDLTLNSFSSFVEPFITPNILAKHAVLVGVGISY